MPVRARELELDLDAFEGPFDLLLTLVLKEELAPAEVDVAEIVVAFCERLEPVDLEACGEFLVLVAALLELKARSLFPDEAAELAELEPEEAAEELARRLAEYRRAKQAAALLAVGKLFRIRPPALFALYVSYYTFGRFFEELLRIDPAHHFAGLRLNAWVSIVVFVCSTGFFVWWQFIRKGGDEPGRARAREVPTGPAMAVPRGRVRPQR